VNLKTQAIAGLIWSACSSWGRQLIAFLVFTLLARVLSAEEFGLVSLAYVFLSFVQIFIHQGFTVAIVQKQEIDEEHLDTAFWSNICVSIIFTIASILFASFIADMLKQPKVAPIIQWLSVNFILFALSTVQDSLLKRKMQFKSLAIRGLISIIVGGIVGSAMALMGYGVWSLVFKQLAESFIGMLTLWHASDWRPKFRISIEKFKELFSFGMAILGIEISNYISTNSDNFIIGYVLGPTALGYYSIAYRFLVISTSFVTAIISNVTLPIFSRLQNEPAKFRNAFYMAVKLSSILNFPIFALIGMLAPEIISFCFGEKWLPSVPTMRVLSFVGIYYSFMYLYADVIISKGQPHLRLKIMLLSSIINFVSFYIVIRWGIIAVAIVLALQNFLVATPLYLITLRKLASISIKVYLQQFISASICSLIMVTSTYFLREIIVSYTNFNDILILSISASLGIILYVGIIYLLDPNLFKYLLHALKGNSPEGA
jgi:O-antigen/teichoic acid export membrane protein